MPSKPNPEFKVYLDLDRTLFQTNLFDRLRWQLLAEWYPEKIDLAKDPLRQSDFYVYRGELYFYDFTTHMRTLGLDVSEVYARLRVSSLADGRLEYTGVRELVEWIRERGEVRVLTFGPENYQSLKIALCPSLRDVETIITGEEKSIFFHSLDASTEEIWMVDDKPIRNLPQNVHFVQANLDGAEVAEQSWPVITELSELPEVISMRME